MRGKGPRRGSGGPKLPAQLTKELFGDRQRGSARDAPRGGGGAAPSRRDRRKADRHSKKVSAQGIRRSHSSHRPNTQEIKTRFDARKRKQPLDDGAFAENNQPQAIPAKHKKKQRPISVQDPRLDSNFKSVSSQQPRHSPAGRLGSTRFQQLLPAGNDAELALQRELAKKLGLRKGDANMGGDDGLDDLLQELGGINDIFFEHGDSDEYDDEPRRHGKTSKTTYAKHTKEKATSMLAEAPSETSDGYEDGFVNVLNESLSSEEEDEGEDSDAFDASLEESDHDLREAEQALVATRHRRGRGRSENGGVRRSTSSSGRDDDEEEEEEDDEDDDTARQPSDHLGGVSEAPHEHDDLGLYGDDRTTSDDSGASQKEGRDDDDDSTEHTDSESVSEDDGGGVDADSEFEAGFRARDKLAANSAAAQKQNMRGGGRIASTGPTASQRYVPPAVRRAAAADGGVNADVDADVERVARRVRGLLNRLAESNVQGIVTQLAELYAVESRSVVSSAVASELVSAAAEGPRATDRFAAVAATAVAGLAASARASEIIATFLSALAIALEASMKESTSLSATNLVLVLSHLFLAGAVKADLIFSLLDRWSREFDDNSVTAVAGMLRAAGLALRATDPERMRDFVVAVHSRAAQGQNNKESGDNNIKQPSGGVLSTRARVMLDLVIDIKNNRKRDGLSAGPSSLRNIVTPALTKWLRSLSVADVAVGGIPWDKVLSAKKRGTWWEPTADDAAAAARDDLARHADKAAFLTAGGRHPNAAASDFADQSGGMAGPELLRLAAAMRMNTDTRRAVFCAVMGSEDAVDAAEKLLRLGLKGEQEREVVRVPIECCLHEAAWNPYYSYLLMRLCTASKGHKITLQYCLWDHFKETGGMDIRRLTNLARLTGTLLAKQALPLTLLKVVDFQSVNVSARQAFFWRLMFEEMLAGVKSDDDVATLFVRVAGNATYEAFKTGVRTFLKRSVGPWLASKDPTDPVNGGEERLGLLLKRCHLAEQALTESLRR